ncbi:hypothetical protein L2K70_04700 [Nocardioides KLBMP 9356]|uniref:Uncharacterized protein n=1 Tax=Nocardioides potassii TaxID=2911371 RepID=A0ABS9H9K5_9ACTN|nr:hypothetical protein [Nocardioides potassii]MCF6376894.1 hypothetical protein [Nocardioides potassii]
MTLPVPLTVRVGLEHVTDQVQSLSFRREAVGGVRSIAFTLTRPLSDLGGLEPLAKVCVYNARSAKTVADGRLSDTGRTASADGQRWDCVAFGPAQHASDDTRPLIYVDRSASDGWRTVDVTNPSASMTTSTRPGDTAANATQGLLMTFPDGSPLVADSRVVARYDRIWQAAQKLGAISVDYVAGLSSSTWLLQAIARTDAGASLDPAFTVAATTGLSGVTGVVGGSFANGRNTVELRWIWTGGPTTTAGDSSWGWFGEISVRAMLVDRSGADITTGYSNEYVLAHEVVNDLLGRVLLDYDGANATVATTSTMIGQLAYPDGITAEQVLADLMAIEPAYRWTTGPDTTGNGYAFRWELWPTTVRYEATLDDGGSFPISTQNVFNQVAVKWVDSSGVNRWSYYTGGAPILDEAGFTRMGVVDLGSEAGSQTAAAAAGAAFLAEHNVPKNAGTLTVARPIRDVLTGAMVQPWEIEAGELVRVLGVEAYPDAFNAADNDGQGVFRIFAVDYTTEGNVATLALDSDPRDTSDALVKLLKDRQRR